MTPTQAQIEAADILRELKVREPCMIDMDGVRPAKPDRAQYIILDIRERDEIVAALTAAAEAAEHSAIDAFNKGYKQAWDNATAATIERCARAAESTWAEGSDKIAAAIRAMKEEGS